MKFQSKKKYNETRLEKFNIFSLLQVYLAVYEHIQYAHIQIHWSLSGSNESPAPDWRQFELVWSEDWKYKQLGCWEVARSRVMMIKKQPVLWSSEMLTKLHPQIFVFSPLSVHRVRYSCSLGNAKISTFCAPAGQFQQHCHRRHFSRLRWTGELHRSTCHLLDGPQYLRGAHAVGVSPRLLPQLRER